MTRLVQPRAISLFGAILGLAILGLGIALKPYTVTLLVFLAVFLWTLSWHLEFGLLVLAGLALMNTWMFSFEKYASLFREFPQFAALNAPVVDFWAVGLLIAFLLHQIREFWAEKRPQFRAPAMHWYALFVLSACVSLFALSYVELAGSIKYLFRFLVFAYVGYVLLPVNICRTKQTFEQLMKTVVLVGIGGALMGIISILVGTWQVGGFVRAVPFAIFGWAPFGYQHILLAEVLTSVLPIALFLYWKSEGRKKSFWGAGSFLIFITALLTLSRAAWVVLAVQSILFIVLTGTYVDWKAVLHKLRLPILLICVLAVYMLGFILLNPTVQSSNSARIELARISYALFRESPWIGQGVGTFVNRLAEVSVFRLEFGDPIEAHGVIQKVGAEQGTFGLLTFGAFFLVFFTRLIKRIRSKLHNNDARMYAFMGFFLALGPFIFQLFNTHYYSSKLWVPIGIALAALSLYETDRKHGKVFQGDAPRIIITE